MSDRPTILLVDDNANNRLAVRTVLKGVEAEIHEASNGFDALSLSLENNYALILLDVSMPEMNGFEVCEQLRADPRTKETPVVFLSAAYKALEDNIRGYVAGATDYLAKPVSDHILRAKVQVFLNLYRQRQALREANAALRIAATAFEAQVGIIVTDALAVILRVNHTFSDLTGYSSEEAVGRTPAMLKSGRHDPTFYRAMWETLLKERHWQGEIWNRRKNGEIYPEWLTITAVVEADGAITHYVGTFTDITLRKAAEKRIFQLAFYDPLTELPNRRLLMDRLEQARIASQRNHSQGALLFIDLDRFKTLNDSQGHDIGDLMLIETAQRLCSCVRESDTVARLGGDEFVVMLELLDGEQEQAVNHSRAVGEKILDVLSQPYSLNGYEHHGSSSIGITLFHGGETSVEVLLKHADTAMYEAKDAGRNTLRFFDPAMQAALEERIAMETDLRRALTEGQLRLYYQPQFDASRRLLGAEALLRWEHPVRGLVVPAEFIPLAEETGLIVPIGLWVLETACAQIQAWGDSLPDTGFSLAVNVSARQFRHPDFVSQVRELQHRSGVAAHRLKLELTESVVLDDIDDAISKMSALRAMGIGFSMDDFGTGYSSLSYLKRLPLDQLKIDQSFIRDLDIDPGDKVIVQTIIGMGCNLGLEVIAEGVETETQIEFLQQQGCHAFQGFLFSRPLPADEFTRQLLS